MDWAKVRDWVIFGSGVLVWAFTLGAVWNRINNQVAAAAEDRKQIRKDQEAADTQLAKELAEKLAMKADRSDLNGLGGRVGSVEASCNETGGRMSRFEKELSEYRAEARDASSRMVRVEKGVEELKETIRDGNTAIGVQLIELSKAVTTMDKNTANRLVRLETVTAIEKKIGPLSQE